jgi:uncharacterized ferritin-like protein (DUF455 family)
LEFWWEEVMTNQQQIAKLEREANRTDIDASTRLALIHRIYELRGIPKEVYSGD